MLYAMQQEKQMTSKLRQSNEKYYYDLPWTDEELDIIINSKNSPTQKDLKQAILNLYKEKE